MTSTPASRTALYRLYAEDGQLLYIGITRNPKVRFAQHADTKEWWPQVARKDIRWHLTRASAAAAEEAAIKSQHPLYNVEHSAITYRISITTDWTAALDEGLDTLCQQLGFTRADVFGSLITRELEARGLLGEPPCYHLFTGVLDWPEHLIAPPWHDPRSRPCACGQSAVGE